MLKVVGGDILFVVEAVSFMKSAHSTALTSYSSGVDQSTRRSRFEAADDFIGGVLTFDGVRQIMADAKAAGAIDGTSTTCSPRACSQESMCRPSPSASSMAHRRCGHRDAQVGIRRYSRSVALMRIDATTPYSCRAQLRFAV